MGIVGKSDSVIPWQRLFDPKALPTETFSIPAALEFPAAQSAVDTLASEVASMEIVIERLTDDRVWEPIPVTSSDHRLLAGKWNPFESAESSVEWLTRSTLTHGFGAAYIQRRGNKPVAIWPLDPEKVTRRELKGRITTTYNDEVQIIPRVLPRSDLIWIDFRPPFNRVDLVSPLLSQWRSIRSGLAVTYFLNYFFDRAGLPNLFFLPGADVASYNEKTNEEMNEALQKMRNIGSRAYTAPIGYDVKNLSVTPQAAQAIEIMYAAVDNVGRLYRIPPIMLQNLRYSNYSNYNGAVRALNRTAGHWARKIQIEISNAIWPLGQRRMILKANTLYGESYRDVAGGTRDLVFGGILSQDEARARLNYPPENTKESRALVRDSKLVPEAMQPEPVTPNSPQSEDTQEQEDV